MTREGRLWVAVLVFTCAPVSAQTIYKCTGADGVPAYQSSPCGNGLGMQTQWQPLAEPGEADAKARAELEARIERDRQSVRAHNAKRHKASGASGSRVRARNATACDAARARREATLQRVGLKRNFELLRKLDDAVFNACR